MMKLILPLLVIILLLLQYKLWFEDNSLAQMVHLKHEITLQQQENTELLQRNANLLAEVKNLKSGDDAIEARARSELGMIKKDETFYQIN